MRKEFFVLLYQYMKTHPDVVVLTADLGYGGFDKIQQDFPDRFYNVGASEQAMMGMAVGLSLAGKTPITYTITPFYFRAFETIRNYIDHEQISVKMIGSGQDADYAHDGWSHDATDVEKAFSVFSHIDKLFPVDTEHMKKLFDGMMKLDKPTLFVLKR